MDVIYHDCVRNPEKEKELNPECRTLEDMLESSDFVSMNVPLAPETHHMIGGLDRKRGAGRPREEAHRPGQPATGARQHNSNAPHRKRQRRDSDQDGRDSRDQLALR